MSVLASLAGGSTGSQASLQFQHHQQDRLFTLSSSALEAARTKAERSMEARVGKSSSGETDTPTKDASVSVKFCPKYSAEQYKRFLEGSAISVARVRHAAFSQSTRGLTQPFEDKTPQDKTTHAHSPGSPLSTRSSGPAARHKLYKTELCRNWQEAGTCRYQSRCQFAHGPAELRDSARHCKYKTEPCVSFARFGSCPYGTRCVFLHCPGSPAASMKLTSPDTDFSGSSYFHSRRASLSSLTSQGSFDSQNQLSSLSFLGSGRKAPSYSSMPAVGALHESSSLLVASDEHDEWDDLYDSLIRSYEGALPDALLDELAGDHDPGFVQDYTDAAMNQSSLLHNADRQMLMPLEEEQSSSSQYSGSSPISRGGFSTPLPDSARQEAWLDELIDTPKVSDFQKKRDEAGRCAFAFSALGLSAPSRPTSVCAFTERVPTDDLERRLCHNLSFMPANELIRTNSGETTEFDLCGWQAHW